MGGADHWVAAHPRRWGVVAGAAFFFMAGPFNGLYAVAFIVSPLFGFLNWWAWRPGGPAHRLQARLNAGPKLDEETGRLVRRRSRVSGVVMGLGLTALLTGAVTSELVWAALGALTTAVGLIVFRRALTLARQRAT